MARRETGRVSCRVRRWQSDLRHRSFWRTCDERVQIEKLDMLEFDTPEIDEFWEEACAYLGISENSRHCALTFAEPNRETDVAEWIDPIADNAVNRMKRGTAHLAMQFEKDDIPMRQVGDYWIVLKCDGSPQCVVQIIGIEILPFNKVGPIFAASEGDGDLSLRYWRQGHMAQFKDQCKRWDVAWCEDYPVVCESFITVYRPGDTVPPSFPD